MKKLKFKKSLLVLIGVLITSLTSQVWAYEFDYPVIYFDNQSGTDWSNTMFLYYYSYKNGAKGSQGYALKKINNTKLWCQYLQHNRGTDMDYFEYIFGDLSGAWSHESHDGSSAWNTRKSSFQSQTNGKYSGTATTNMNKKTWLATSTGTSNLTVTWKTDARQEIPPSSMKFNQTVNVVVNGNSSPSKSPAAISITSHYWTAWDAVSSAGSSTAITKGGSTITDAYNNAAYTAETSVEVTSIQDGYYFVGWYDAATGGSLVSDANPYTYYPREANTLYARFESKHTVNIYASMHGGAVGCTTTPSNGTAINNVGYYTSADISATAGNGCFFDQWSTTGGVSVGGTKTNPTTVKTAGSDGTVTAHFYTQWAIMGGHDDDHTGSSDDLGDWVDSYNDLVYVSNNSFIGKITLSAGTYKFKVYDRQNNTYWGCNTTISGSVKDYVFYSSGDNDKNCSLTISTAGEYIFAWNDADHKLSLIYPSDRDKAILVKGSIIYFNMTTGNGTGNYWHNADFTARFWFKTLAGKDYTSVDKAKGTTLENWIYYATVPNCDYIGRVQMNRMDPAGGLWNTAANVNVAVDRTTTTGQYPNCIVYNHDSYTPTLTWDTYCPPMSSATLSDHSTTRIYWQDEGNDGSESSKAIWVSTSNTIEVSGAATKALDDPNMTINYDFKVDGSSAQASSTSTYSKGSLSNGTTYTITMDAYNTYNSATGTKLTASQTLYYKAYNTYGVTNDLTNISSSGRSGAGALADGVAYAATLSVGTGYNLPASITVKRGETTLTGGGTHYTYDSSTGALNISGAQITGNITITAAGVAKTYTGANNLDKNGGDSHGQYTATFDATTIAIGTTPVKANYHVEGYYLESDFTTKIADASGNLVASVVKDAVTYTDGGGKWKNDGNVTLYTKWEENSFTVTVNAGSHGKVGDNQSSISVTGHPITASSNFTVTADAGYAFSHWTFSVASVADTNFVSRGGTNNATQTFNVTTTAAVTMTANYVVRYGLYGSLDNIDGGNEYGMPGWGASADFTYSDGSYTITRTLTRPNANYKFRVLDRRNNFSYGCSENYQYAKNDQTLTLNSGNYNAFIGTAGKGSYQLTVTEVSSGAYPAVQITSHPESYVVHFGKKAFSYEGDDLGDLDATITVTDAAGNTYADGKYIATGETVTIRATDIPTGYHFAEWHANSDYSYEFGDKENPHSWTVTQAVNAYAKFIEEANIFNATNDSYWSTDGNWSKGTLPLITDVVYINKPIIVDVNAKAKRVTISNNGDDKTGKITINAGKRLIVAQTIQKNNGSSLVATDEEDIVINSNGSNGVGALIWGTTETTPGEATVNFYSISGGAKDNKASVNQFIGTPFQSHTNWVYNYYNSWLLDVEYPDGDKPRFKLLGGGDTMDPFKGYCVIYNGDAGHTYEMTGTLVSNANQSIDLRYVNSTTANNENVLANSWLAPIRIQSFQSTDFVNADATIYIFNAGSENDTPGAAAVDATGAAQWITVPINSASWDSKTPTVKVIPSMQSFSIYANNSDPSKEPSITLDYNKLVYTPAVNDQADIVPNRAPKREAEQAPNVMHVFVEGASGYRDMVWMLEREDFTTGFDNGWDGRKIYGDKETPQLYTLSTDGNMAVAAEPTFEGTILGFKAGTEDDTYTFSFEYEEDQTPLYLYDMNTQAYTRVLSGNTYMFTTTDKDAHNRFSLTHNAPSTATGIGNNWMQGDGTKAVKFIENGKLFILQNGRLYDATGALVK